MEGRPAGTLPAQNVLLLTEGLARPVSSSDKRMSCPGQTVCFVMSAEAGRTLRHTCSRSVSVGHPGRKPASVSLPLARARVPHPASTSPTQGARQRKSEKSRWWRMGTAGQNGGGRSWPDVSHSRPGPALLLDTHPRPGRLSTRPSFILPTGPPVPASSPDTGPNK